jgi:hypothetical protein
MVVVEHVDLDSEIIVGEAGDVEGGGVGQCGVVPKDDASVAGAGAESSDGQDVGVANVGPLHALDTAKVDSRRSRFPQMEHLLKVTVSCGDGRAIIQPNSFPDTD